MQWEEVRRTYPDQLLKVEIRTLRGLREACNMEMSMEQPALTDEQKKRMTSVIFTNANVLSQLRQAQKDREEGIFTYSDNEEEFARLLKLK